MLTTKILHSYGNNEIAQYKYDLPIMRKDELLIKTIYTGICRSDIDQYLGRINIPFGHFGHESLGEVKAIGKQVETIKVGDIVSARTDPAYSTYFYSTESNCVVVPEISPKYIIEPVACGINILRQVRKLIDLYQYRAEPILLIGSGFISNVIAQMINVEYYDITVVGTHNLEQWKSSVPNAKLVSSLKDIDDNRFRVIIDLSGKNYHEILRVAKTNSIICFGAAFHPKVETDFFKSIWDTHTFVFPSPRNAGFISCMLQAVNLIREEIISTDWAWTHKYKVDDFKRAFEESVDRKDKSFVRSYIDWRP